MTPFTYETTGRNWATLVTVVLVWAVIAAMVVFVDMAPVLAVIAVLVTLPAVYDLASARPSGLYLDDQMIRWYSGKKTGEVALSKVKHIRFDTRLDLSVRVTLVLHIGQKLKIPFDATPPHRAFEAELEARGFKTERHHFGFI